jgi:hypothetical protein
MTYFLAAVQGPFRVNRTRSGRTSGPYASAAPETGRERRAQHRMRGEKASRGLSIQFESSAISSKSAISSTRWTMRRRSPGSFICMNALMSASPSVVPRNSET